MYLYTEKESLLFTTFLSDLLNHKPEKCSGEVSRFEKSLEKGLFSREKRGICRILYIHKNSREKYIDRRMTQIIATSKKIPFCVTSRSRESSNRRLL